MRLLILGGSQFLGRAIAARACASGRPVVGLTGDEEKDVLAAWHARREVSKS